jgi:hypothetical protein
MELGRIITDEAMYLRFRVIQFCSSDFKKNWGIKGVEGFPKSLKHDQGIVFVIYKSSRKGKNVSKSPF